MGGIRWNRMDGIRRSRMNGINGIGWIDKDWMDRIE